MVIEPGMMVCLFAEDTLDRQTQIQVIVKETSSVKTPRVFLGDISYIHANGFLKEALEKIDMGPSPKPDKIKFYDKRKIISVIQGQRYLPDDIIITSPLRVYVKRLSQIISKQDVKKFIDQSLSRVLKNRDYKVSAFSVRGLEPYPQGNIQFSSDSMDMVDKNGKLSIFLDILINGKKEDRVSVSGVVSIYETVLCVKRSYSKGEMLSKENVYMEKRKMNDLDDTFIKSFDEIDGKILKSAVNRQESLKPGFFSVPPLIQKGDIVTLIARYENLLIVTTGVSIEDGFENELIKVENLDSGKLVRGIVKKKSKVEVVY